MEKRVPSAETAVAVGVNVVAFLERGGRSKFGSESESVNRGAVTLSERCSFGGNQGRMEKRVPSAETAVVVGWAVAVPFIESTGILEIGLEG